MWDLLLFRKMLTPLIVQIFFLLGVILCIIGAVYNFTHHAVAHGLQILIIGPIILRVLCEFLIIFFRIHESLVDLKNTVQEKP